MGKALTKVMSGGMKGSSAPKKTGEYIGKKSGQKKNAKSIRGAY